MWSHKQNEFIIVQYTYIYIYIYINSTALCVWLVYKIKGAGKLKAKLKSKTKAQDRGAEVGLWVISKLLDRIRVPRKVGFATWHKHCWGEGDWQISAHCWAGPDRQQLQHSDSSLFPAEMEWARPVLPPTGPRWAQLFKGGAERAKARGVGVRSAGLTLLAPIPFRSGVPDDSDPRSDNDKRPLAPCLWCRRPLTGVPHVCHIHQTFQAAEYFWTGIFAKACPYSETSKCSFLPNVF